MVETTASVEGEAPCGWDTHRVSDPPSSELRIPLRRRRRTLDAVGTSGGGWWP